MFYSIFKKKYSISFVLLFILICPLVIPKSVEAKTFCESVEPLEIEISEYEKIDSTILQLNWPSINERDLDTVAQGQSIEEIFGYFFYLFLWIAVIIAFLTLIYIGFSYYNSGGSPREISKLKQRFKNLIIGILILLFAVSILRFIDSDNQERIQDIKKAGSTVGNYISNDLRLPNDDGFLTKNRDVSDHEYFPIPFTNQAGASMSYSGIHSALYKEDDCNKCNVKNFDKPACSFFCDENSMRIQKVSDIQESLYIGYDTLKNNLECKIVDLEKEIKSYAIVDSDDDTPVSCTAACFAIAKHKGGQHNKCSSDIGNISNNKKFKKWLDDKSAKHFNEARIKGDVSIYSNFYMFGKSGSLNDGDLKNASIDLRKCIAEKYVYEAQEFPVADKSLDLCLCRV